MSFDSETNTITLKDDGEILADSGSYFLKVLRGVGNGADAPEELAADWAIVAGWLGCEARELNQDDYDKFGLVFRSLFSG